MHYEWGHHSSDEQHVHVALVHDGGRREELFDVTFYDPEVIDPDTGRNCLEQSKVDLLKLIALANAALEAGIEPKEEVAA